MIVKIITIIIITTIIITQYLLETSKNNYLSKVRKITNIFDLFKVTKLTDFVYCYHHYYFNNLNY